MTLREWAEKQPVYVPTEKERKIAELQSKMLNSSPDDPKWVRKMNAEHNKMILKQINEIEMEE